MYEKLSKRMLIYLYTKVFLLTAIVFGSIIGTIIIFLGDSRFGNIFVTVFSLTGIIYVLINPIITFKTYGYRIDREYIETIEGYFEFTKHVVPVERVQKIEVSSGPIARLFRVCSITITTAGGNVLLKHIEQDKADVIADILTQWINEEVRMKKEEA